LLQLLREICR